MEHVLGRLHTRSPYRDPVVLQRVDDVWLRLIEKFERQMDHLECILRENPYIWLHFNIPEISKLIPPNVQDVVASAGNSSNFTSESSEDFQIPLFMPAEYVRLCEEIRDISRLINNTCEYIVDFVLWYMSPYQNFGYARQSIESYCQSMNNFMNEELLYRDRCNVFAYIVIDTMTESFALGQTFQFLKTAHYNMNYELRSIPVEIITDKDLSVCNTENLVNTTEFYYIITIIPTVNRCIHLEVENNTLHGVYLTINNSRISANITNNILIRSGIEVKSSASDSYCDVYLEGNTFTGPKLRSAIEIHQTANVYLLSTVFVDWYTTLQTYDFFAPVFEHIHFSIVCKDSNIHIDGLSFQNVSGASNMLFENSWLQINDLYVSDSHASGSSVYLTHNLMYLINSFSLVTNSVFKDNTGANFLVSFRGSITLENTTYWRNKMSVIRIVDSYSAIVDNAEISVNEDFCFSRNKISSEPVFNNIQRKLWTRSISF